MFGLPTASADEPVAGTPTSHTERVIAQFASDPVVAGPDAARATTGAGRTRITARALERIATAATAEALGVDARRVDVDLRDREGELDLVASSSIGVVPIDRVIAEPRVVEHNGGTVLDRCAAAEHAVRARMHEVAGCRVQRVTLRLTGVELAREHRVR